MPRAPYPSIMSGNGTKSPFAVPETGEQRRLAELRAYALLDTPPEAPFDELVALASRICGTPISLVSLVDEDRQWFKATIGLGLRETPRSVSFCQHAIRRPGEMMVVPDATRDERFAQNPLVTGELGIRFYAGMPIVTPSGQPLGTLCVIDRKPRTLSAEQTEALQVLAHQVSSQLELRRALNVLGMTEERFRLLAGATSDALWDWNLVTDTVWWSEGFHTLFGYGPEEVEPSSDFWVNLIHPDDKDRVTADLNAGIAGRGVDQWSSEYRFLCRDGHYATVRDRAKLVRDQAGRAVRIIGGMTDVTDQKKLEAQYLRAQRMESIGTLAGGIAHDLNNVLAPILMGIEMLKRDAQNPSQLKLLGTIETSTRRGADLVRQVLSFARGLDGQRAALRLSPLLKEVVKIAAETFPRGISLTHEIDPALWPIEGDPTQLHQVLLNLAVNARDAMPKGGALVFTAANLIIDEQYARTSHDAKPGQHVVITVRDTGTGISAQNLPRIFEPFFTTKPVGEGTGLGLSTVHAIVKSHGGFITVQSEVGRGTTFRVHLPADPNLRSHSEHPFVANIPRGRGELVLIVDDEPAVRIVTQQTLEAFGYRVLEAADGAEAIAIYAQHQDEVALVLTDMVMPVMDGLTTIAALTRIKPDLRIIAASGFNTTLRPDSSAHGLVKHFLPKPYNAETLLKLVRSVLDAPAGEMVVAAGTAR